MIERNSSKYYDHPVFHPLKLSLVTPMMLELKEVITRWLWTGSTGGIISGISHAGKTRAVMSLAKSLRSRSNVAIPSYYISIPRRDLHTITSIFRTLCYSVNLRVSNSDRSDHLSDRFIHYVLDYSDEFECVRIPAQPERPFRFNVNTYSG